YFRWQCKRPVAQRARPEMMNADHLVHVSCLQTETAPLQRPGPAMLCVRDGVLFIERGLMSPWFPPLMEVLDADSSHTLSIHQSACDAPGCRGTGAMERVLHWPQPDERSTRHDEVSGGKKPEVSLRPAAPGHPRCTFAL